MTRDDEGEAVGAPAPFTEGQVEELRRGTLTEEAVAAVLKAFSTRRAGKPPRSTKRSPVSVTEDDLIRLAEDGVTPAAIKKRLEDAARKGAADRSEPEERGEQPTKRPPGAGR